MSDPHTDGWKQPHVLACGSLCRNDQFWKELIIPTDVDTQRQKRLSFYYQKKICVRVCGCETLAMNWLDYERWIRSCHLVHIFKCIYISSSMLTHSLTHSHTTYFFLQPCALPLHQKEKLQTISIQPALNVSVGLTLNSLKNDVFNAARRDKPDIWRR